MVVSPIAVIFAGGDPEPPAVRTRLPDDRVVIAADSGLHTAAALGIQVDLIVGDLDSAAPEAMTRAIHGGATVERHPTDKDATDLELAIDAAVERGVERVILIGGASLDRIDHFMANALLLASPRFAALTIEWFVQGAHVIPIRSSATIPGDLGDLVTLLAVGGPATGVTTRGLQWPLAGDTLEPGSTRGVSNVIDRPPVTVDVASGTVLAIHLQEESA